MPLERDVFNLRITECTGFHRAPGAPSRGELYGSGATPGSRPTYKEHGDGLEVSAMRMNEMKAPRSVSEAASAHLLAYGEFERLSIGDGRQLERRCGMSNKVGFFSHGERSSRYEASRWARRCR
jgi:hypothetical protein